MEEVFNSFKIAKVTQGKVSNFIDCLLYDTVNIKKAIKALGKFKNPENAYYIFLMEYVHQIELLERENKLEQRGNFYYIEGIGNITVSLQDFEIYKSTKALKEFFGEEKTDNTSYKISRLNRRFEKFSEFMKHIGVATYFSKSRMDNSVTVIIVPTVTQSMLSYEIDGKLGGFLTDVENNRKFIESAVKKFFNRRKLDLSEESYFIDNYGLNVLPKLEYSFSLELSNELSLGNVRPANRIEAFFMNK